MADQQESTRPHRPSVAPIPRVAQPVTWRARQSLGRSARPSGVHRRCDAEDRRKLRRPWRSRHLPRRPCRFDPGHPLHPFPWGNRPVRPSGQGFEGPSEQPVRTPSGPVFSAAWVMNGSRPQPHTASWTTARTRGDIRGRGRSRSQRVEYSLPALPRRLTGPDTAPHLAGDTSVPSPTVLRGSPEACTPSRPAVSGSVLVGEPAGRAALRTTASLTARTWSKSIFSTRRS